MIRHTVKPARRQQDMGQTPFHKYELDDGTVWTEFYRSASGYVLRFPGLADFDVSADGKEVIAHPLENTDKATVEHLYINQLVPLALSRQGRPTFHASVVTVPGGAVAFLGESGAGKSTLAASFALNDAAFLTDDALLIEESEGDCWVLPSHASLRLWEDSVAALVGDDNPQADQVSYSSKTRLLAGQALEYRDHRQLLLAAFVLQPEESAAISIEALTGADRYMGWLENSFLLDIEDHELLARHFEWTHRISGAIPTYALNYPRDYGILPTLRNTIQKHMADHDS